MGAASGGASGELCAAAPGRLHDLGAQAAGDIGGTIGAVRIGHDDPAWGLSQRCQGGGQGGGGIPGGYDDVHFLFLTAMERRIRLYWNGTGT